MFSYTGLSAAQVDNYVKNLVSISSPAVACVSPGKYGKCTMCGKGVCCGDVMQEAGWSYPACSEIKLLSLSLLFIDDFFDAIVLRER